MGLNEKQVSLDFGFEAEFKESEFTTISGKEQTNVKEMDSISLNEILPGLTYDGYPEISIFHNEPKEKPDGSFTKGYDSIRVRLIDEEEYLDCYANIPKIDEEGFVENINKSYNFFRTGFDLVYSFMRYFDEVSIIAEDGKEMNYIKKVNIFKICEYIDKMDRVEVKITKGADNGYNSFFVMNMQ